jgi:hypothetical protein
MRSALFLADVVVVVHLAYLGFVVLGGFLGLHDVHWLLPHAAAVVWGVVGTVGRAPCPLTALEKWLVSTGGGTPYDGPFISHYVTGTLYPAAAEEQVWQATAALVVASYMAVLAHDHRRREGHVAVH